MKSIERLLVIMLFVSSFLIGSNVFAESDGLADRAENRAQRQADRVENSADRQENRQDYRADQKEDRQERRQALKDGEINKKEFRQDLRTTPRWFVP